MFEQHPPLCRIVIPEGKGIIFSSRLSTRLGFSPCPEGRAVITRGATMQRGNGGAGRELELLPARTDLSLMSQPSSGSVCPGDISTDCTDTKY